MGNPVDLEADVRATALEIEALRREYEERVRPLVRRLCFLDNFKRPAPIVADDGRIFEYVGPVPEYTAAMRELAFRDDGDG